MACEIDCLDLGTNTFHLERIRLSDADGLRTVLDHKHSVRMGASVYRDGRIDQQAWDRGLLAVEQLMDRARDKPADQLVAVATGAMRNAFNGREFLEGLQARFGLDVELLSTVREAELSYLGATTDRRVGGRRAVVVDLGGGSAELAVGEGTGCLLTDSLPIGTLRLRAGLGDRPTDRTLACELARSLKVDFGPRLQRLAEYQPELVVFASGTARSARRLALAGTEPSGPTGRLGLADLHSSLARHADHSPADLVHLGVDPARADTVLLAHVVMIVVMEALGATGAHVSDTGLRPGLALREYRRGRGQQRRGTAA